jgi:hypothetical protein
MNPALVINAPDVEGREVRCDEDYAEGHKNQGFMPAPDREAD